MLCELTGAGLIQCTTKTGQETIKQQQPTNQKEEEEIINLFP